MKIACTIAGSDSGGGAGIQSDLKTFHDLGVHGCSVITAITAQNSHEITDCHFLPAPEVGAQLEAILSDLAPQAIKIGMVGSIENLDKLAGLLTKFSGDLVLDPLLFSGKDQSLLQASLKEYLAKIRQFLPLCVLVTPNKMEAEMLLGKSICSSQDMIAAAQEFLNLGVKSVLIKGGHFEQGAWCQDFWMDANESFWLSTSRTARVYHGTGCMLSAAITAALAKGYSLKDSLILGKMYVNQGMRLAYQPGKGAWILSHAAWPEQQQDFPFVSSQPSLKVHEHWLPCGNDPLGIYPIVNRAEWLERLLPLKVTTIQLRIKDLTGSKLEQELAQAVAIARKYRARLFINDYWRQAIRLGAYGVHLGQEDLQQADLTQIRQANLRLGVSTHCYYEVAHAISCRPSYIACGPIFPTTSKVMPFAPQGIANLARWRRTLNYPLVAIGGINAARLPNVLATGVSGVAMISEIVAAADPVQKTKELVEYLNSTMRFRTHLS